NLRGRNFLVFSGNANNYAASEPSASSGARLARGVTIRRLLSLERRQGRFLRPTDRNRPAAIVSGEVPVTNILFARLPRKEGRLGVYDGREAHAAVGDINHLDAKFVQLSHGVAAAAFAESHVVLQLVTSLAFRPREVAAVFVQPLLFPQVGAKFLLDF